MGEINFFAEEIVLPLSDKDMARRWIQRVVSGEQQEIGELTFIFCSDEYLLRINQEYLNHDTYTDIITFDLRDVEGTGPLIGEIYISTDRVKDNANTYGVGFNRELHRVMIHGVWHLMGQGDKTEEDQRTMRAKENHSLSLLMRL